GGDPGLERHPGVAPPRVERGDGGDGPEPGVEGALLGDAAGRGEQHPELALASLDRGAPLGDGRSAGGHGPIELGLEALAYPVVARWCTLARRRGQAER